MLLFTRRTVRTALLGISALLFASAGQAQLPASTTQLIITKPGTYVLNRGINVVSGDAIIIRASGVTLDLNGHTLSTQNPGNGRGVWIDGVNGVQVKNGKVSGFNLNITANAAQNLCVENLQIVGAGLAPSGGPSEIGILLLNVKGAKIKDNTITSVNLGLFVRGGSSCGNRIVNNTVTGSDTPGNNILGLCYNPAPGGAPTDPGPRGDLIYNNHISGYTDGMAFSPGSKANIVRENTIAFFSLAFRASTVFGPADTVVEGNLTTQLP